MSRRLIMPNPNQIDEECKGCSEITSCLIRGIKSRRKICPCRQCLIKVSCREFCAKRICLHSVASLKDYKRRYKSWDHVMDAIGYIV
jgi:hypothetical protein